MIFTFYFSFVSSYIFVSVVYNECWFLFFSLIEKVGIRKLKNILKQLYLSFLGLLIMENVSFIDVESIDKKGKGDRRSPNFAIG